MFHNDKIYKNHLPKAICIDEFTFKSKMFAFNICNAKNGKTIDVVLDRTTYNLDKYFIDNYAYFIKNDKDILGFVLIDDNKNNDYEISEIFVLNNYKRNKIGKEVAIKVFDMYKGNWIIKAVPNSKIAESFWKMVVKDYTNNNYIEKYTGKYNRLEIYFSNGDLYD